MADNVAVTAGTGTTIAADEVVDGTLGTVKVQYVKLMDGALDGTTKAGVGANGLKVDGSGVTQPVSLTSTTITGTVAVTQSGAWSLSANQSMNVAQFNGVTPLMGNGVSGTGAQRVTIASDNTAFSVNATLTAETTKVIGVTRTSDGSGNLLTSTGNALDINIKSGVNLNGRNTPANSAPVVLNSMTYKAVAASASATLFGATGASGDYLDGVLIIPATAAAGAVSITDGSGSAITIFAGGGTTALPTLAPFYVPIGAISSGGVGGWKVTTGTNVSVIGVGNFT